nr:ficolin-1-like [Lytechinus pictus]
MTVSGIYGIYLEGSGRFVDAYCDMVTAGGGWTVIQRRMDGSVDFDKTWAQYKKGFGSVSAKHWLGNDNIHFLTSLKTYQLRIDLVDFYGNTSNATYNPFSVGNESVNYKLEIGSYSGSAAIERGCLFGFTKAVQFVRGKLYSFIAQATANVRIAGLQ